MNRLLSSSTALLLWVIALGADATASAPTESNGTSFEADLRIDEPGGAKKFQGVWLELDGGERWVIDYRAHGCWTSFDGKRVRVTGARYEPEGQAITAVHFDVTHLELVDPTQATTLATVGDDVVVKGRLTKAHGQAGSKSEGSTWWALSTDSGQSWRITNPSAVEERAEGPVQIRGRAVSHGPFVAHADGDWLWVLSVNAWTEPTEPTEP